MERASARGMGSSKVRRAAARMHRRKAGFQARRRPVLAVLPAASRRGVPSTALANQTSRRSSAWQENWGELPTTLSKANN